MIKRLKLVFVAGLIFGVPVTAFYLPNPRCETQRSVFRQEWGSHQHLGIKFRSSIKIFQSSPWGDLAAEWAARNRDDSDARITVKDPGFRPSIAVQEVTESTEPISTTKVDMREVEDIWKALDEEVMAMQREAEKALLGLEKMQEDIDLLATDLGAKDENYARKMKEIESRGSQVEAELRKELVELSNDFDAYRMSSETQNQALRRESQEKQNELRAHIEDLKKNLDKQINTLQSERVQSTELKYEKDRLLQELQRIREENSQKVKEFETRVATEQITRTREREEFDTRLRQIQDEASKRLESTIQKFESEKEQIEQDYSTRLQKVSEDLRVASSNLAEAQQIIEEKQAKIDTLEQTVTDLDAWSQESWYQLNRLQDAVGLPVTPTDENDEIPSIEVLEAEALNLIDHLRMRERYFEDAIFDIQTEMQDKESEMNEKLEKLEKEYQQYRNEMDEMMRREGPDVVRKEMQARLDQMGSELEAQRECLKEEAIRAKSFMDARIGIERELETLKKEAAYVIDELENQLRAEQDARKKEAESARKALENVGDVSVQNINKVVAQGQERMRATEKELSTRVARAEKDLRLSRLSSGIFLSVAVTSALVAGLLAQGVRSVTTKDAMKAKDASKAIEQVVKSPKIGQKSPFSFQLSPEDKATSSVIPKFGSDEEGSEIDKSSNKGFYNGVKEKGPGPSNDKAKNVSPHEPLSLTKKESSEIEQVTIRDETKPRTYFAIKEDGEASKQDNMVPESSASVPNADETKPRTYFEIKNGEAPPENKAEQQQQSQSSPSPSADTKAVTASENDGKVSKSYLAIKESGESRPQDRVDQVPTPTTEQGGLGRPRKVFAIKEEGMASQDGSEPSKVESKKAKPGEEEEGRSLQSGMETRTYLAIKDGKESIFKGKKDKSTVQTKESRPKVTVDDDTPLIDWDTLTYKWLDEVENIRSNGANSRLNPAAPKDTVKEAETETDEALDNPLLQQALAPASADDPFGQERSD